MKLTILITNYNTSAFLKVLLEAIFKLTASEFHVVINDNGSSRKDLSKLIKTLNNYDEQKIRIIHSIDHSTPSIAHGNALNRLLALVETEYFAIFDSDCFPLKKNWDEILIKELDDGVEIVGSPFYTGKASSKYQDFPAQFMVVGRTKSYRVSQTTCSPDLINNLDTCMQWREDFKKSNFKGKVLCQVNTRDKKILEFGNVTCVVYFLNGQIIGSHFGRGSSGSLAKYVRVGLFSKLPLIRGLLKLTVAKFETYFWKERCRDLIERETSI